jgi:hypothetical protein
MLVACVWNNGLNGTGELTRPECREKAANPGKRHRQSNIWLIVVAAVSLGVIFVVDYYFENASPPLLVVAVLDEIAHLGTALILLIGLGRVSLSPFTVACLVGAVLIDVDHLPAMLSPDVSLIEEERPVTHSVIWVAVLLISSTGLTGQWRSVVVGLSLGILTHLVRDMATGGVPLFWPVSDNIVEIPYWTYAIAIVSTASMGISQSFDRRFDIVRFLKAPVNKILGQDADDAAEKPGTESGG